jgi:hypothetical protein
MKTTRKILSSTAAIALVASAQMVSAADEINAIRVRKANGHI